MEGTSFLIVIIPFQLLLLEFSLSSQNKLIEMPCSPRWPKICDQNSAIIRSLKRRCLMGKGTPRVHVDFHINWFCCSSTSSVLMRLCIANLDALGLRRFSPARTILCRFAFVVVVLCQKHWLCHKLTGAPMNWTNHVQYMHYSRQISSLEKPVWKTRHHMQYSLSSRNVL